DRHRVGSLPEPALCRYVVTQAKISVILVRRRTHAVISRPDLDRPGQHLPVPPHFDFIQGREAHENQLESCPLEEPAPPPQGLLMFCNSLLVTPPACTVSEIRRTIESSSCGTRPPRRTATRPALGIVMQATSRDGFALSHLSSRRYRFHIDLS